jgi:uncharacterized protein
VSGALCHTAAMDAAPAVADTRTLRRFGVGLGSGLLVWSVVGNLGLGERWYVTRNLILLAALLWSARATGLSASELGLAPDRLSRGLWWGVSAAGVVAAVLGTAVVVQEQVGPVAALLGDQRAALPPHQLAYQAAFRIPIGTALFEEVAFRGVLLAVLARSLRPGGAIAVSSVVFGFWHVAPTVVALRINAVPAASPEGIATIGGAVVVTAIAGMLFCWLRLRSGSLAAPILAHWATNALGLLAAAATVAP